MLSFNSFILVFSRNVTSPSQALWRARRSSSSMIYSHNGRRSMWSTRGTLTRRVRWVPETCWTSCWMNSGSRCPWRMHWGWLKDTKWMRKVIWVFLQRHAALGESTFANTFTLSICLSCLLAKQKKRLTKDGFLMYLHQEEGCIFNPAHKHVHQDMTQPLNHYYISSSHNTYLLEDQLKGPSSTEAYIK